MKTFIERIRPYAERRWFMLAACALAFIDLFVLFIPTEALIFLLAFVRPKRWPVAGTVIALASSLGGLAVALVAARYGEPFITWVLGPNFLQSTNWIRMSGWIERYGVGGLWFVSFSPLPVTPAILIATLAKMSPAVVFAMVLLGRFPKYLGYAYLATKSSKYLDEIFGDELETIRGKKDPEKP